MPLIAGDRLTADQRREVLAAFVHRWTEENRKAYGGNCPACEQTGGFPYRVGPVLRDGAGTYRREYTRAEYHAFHLPLTTDDQWLAAHAFHFTRKGRLALNHKSAEPIYLATP